MGDGPGLRVTVTLLPQSVRARLSSGAGAGSHVAQRQQPPPPESETAIAVHSALLSISEPAPGNHLIRRLAQMFAERVYIRSRIGFF